MIAHGKETHQNSALIGVVRHLRIKESGPIIRPKKWIRLWLVENFICVIRKKVRHVAESVIWITEMVNSCKAFGQTAGE